MRTTLLTALLIVVLYPVYVGAQHADSAAATQAAAAPANIGLGAVAGTRAANGETVQAILEASKKDKKGTVALGWRRGTGHTQLTFSGPLDDEEEAEPISLLGLPAGASATFSFSRLNWRGPNARERRDILALCNAAGLDQASKDTTKTCEYRNFAVPEDAAYFRELNHVDDRPWLVGMDVGGSRATHKYLETVVSSPTSATRVTWKAGGKVGVYSPSLGFSFLSFTYNESFLPAGTAANICRPVSGTDALRCQNAVIGAPVYKSMSVIALETRKFIAKAAAIAPSVQRDLENDVTAVEVPVYFLGGGNTPIGGVRFGWRSDTKAVTAAVFIGAAFGLLP